MGRVVVRPDLIAVGQGAYELYLWVRNEGEGIIAVVILDLLARFERTKSPKLPAGFEHLGRRKIDINKGQRTARLDVYRYHWDASRPPLIAGIEEPLSREPIKIGYVDDLADGLVILQVVVPDSGPETRIFQLMRGGALIELTNAPIAVVPNSDEPWYGPGVV